MLGGRQAQGSIGKTTTVFASRGSEGKTGCSAQHGPAAHLAQHDAVRVGTRLARVQQRVHGALVERGSLGHRERLEMGVCWGQSPQLSVCPTVESWQPQKPEIRAAPALSPALKSKHAHWHWLPAPLKQKPHGGAHPHRRSHAGAATVSIHTGARVLTWRPRRFMVVGDISLPMVSTRCRPVKERAGSNGQTAVELCGQPREHRLAGEAARCGVHGMAAGVRAWHAKRATAACGHSPASSAPLAASPTTHPGWGWRRWERSPAQRPTCREAAPAERLWVTLNGQRRCE